MKNLIKTFTFVGIVLFSFSGCADKADYEDKELSKFFIKNNTEKLDKISSINTSYGYEDFHSFNNKRASFITVVRQSIFDLQPVYIGELIQCNYTMHITNSGVKFLEKDVVLNGKEYMYKEAEKCLNQVVNEIDYIEVKKTEKIKNEILDTKFNENEVK